MSTNPMTQTNPLQADVVKPCPFCGGHAGPEKTLHGQTVMHWIKCGTCGATSTAFNSLKSARAAWNTRAPIPLQGGVDVRADVYKVLREFRCCNLHDEDGAGFPLVDLVSNEPPADISTGEEQLRELASEIAYALRPAPSADEIVERCAVKADKCALYEGYGPEAYRQGWECASETIATEIRKMKDSTNAD